MNQYLRCQWKVLAGSVPGTSHQQCGGLCQDYWQFRLTDARERGFIVLVCADGAGSASHSHLGAGLACRTILSNAAATLDMGLPVSAITSDIMRGWYESARCRLSLEACVAGVDLREFASTLLIAVADNECAVFGQLGDGAIVFRVDEGYQIAFWPQSGEYVNTTNFLTSRDFLKHVEIRMVAPPPNELALLTDGLQPLALHYATRTVHAPFFDPMFATLRKDLDPNQLELPLKQFLSSKSVADRTEDDITLILATCFSSSHENS
jgi:hypothetical protein